jgi:uncharacterized protein (TIRG00374 family)
MEDGEEYTMKKLMNFLLSLAVSSGILFLLVRLFKDLNFETILKYLGIKVIIISLLIYLAIKATNTLRYNLTFGTKGFFKTINILFFGNFMLTLLPFRLGEFSYLQQFKKYYNIDYKKGASNIIFIRILDYLSIFILMLISFVLLILKNVEAINDKKILAAFVAIFIITLALVLAYGLLSKSVKAKRNAGFASKALLYANDLIFKERKYKWIILLNSLIYWSLRFFLGIYLLRAVGINLGIVELLFISTMLMLISLIPIQPFAGFGVFEGSWIWMLVLFGVGKEDLLNKTLAVHFISLINVVAFGIISYIILYIAAQNRSGHTYLKKDI